MNLNLRSRFSIGEFVIAACAAIMLIAFFAMPWYELEDGSTVTGLKLAGDTEGNLDLPVRISHMFLIVVPFAAASAGVLALWGMVAPRHDRTIPGLTLAVGLMTIIYYYGGFYVENSYNELGAAEFAHDGFYVALAAAIGLIVQYAIPRPEPVARLSLTRPVFTRFEKPQTAWRWPFVILVTPLRWLRTLIGWSLAHLGRLMAGTPVLAYLIGLVAASELEQRGGLAFARLIGFRRQPSLFGVSEVLDPFSGFDLKFSGILAPFFPAPTDKFDKPFQSSWEAIKKLAEDFQYALSTHGSREPGFFDQLADMLKYDLVVYVITIIVVALLFRRITNWLLRRLPVWGSMGLQFGMLYLAVSRWASLNDNRERILVYMGIYIMMSVSLNLVNGYMGEFSVGHAGFMGVGAYVSAVITMWAFTDNKVFGDAHLSASFVSTEVGQIIGFLIPLLIGGAAAALVGLLVAIPSFRTRGDYLAIVTLAINFFIVGLINNIQKVGGATGLNGVPLWTNMEWVFVLSILSVLAIYALVTSTFGKGIIAIRDDEIAAGLMGVPTRRVKLVAFMVSSFIAGVAGGLLAHLLAFINPDTFGIEKSTEALVMVYLGGQGSISGSVIAGFLYTILVEALSPLGVLKWIVIPLILIFLMFRRPQGLFGYRELKLNLGGIKEEPAGEVANGTAGD